MARGFRQRLCGLLAGVLLLAQWLTAAYACPQLQPLPETVAPCHQGDHAAADPANPALCKAHCEADRQAPSQAPAPDLAPASSGWFIVQLAPVPLLPLAEPPMAWQQARAGAPPGWPPLHITLQVLRN